jgi:glycosyltransferase involved in cell wall biosynthesis
MFGAGQPASGQSHWSNQWREWKKGGRIIAQMKARNVSAVVMNGYNDCGRLRVLRWCRKSGIPLFIWGDSNIRGQVLSSLKVRLKRRVLPAVLHQAEGVFACGIRGREYFRYFGMPDERIYTVPIVPDPQLIREVPEVLMQTLREQVGLAPNRRRLLFSGRLVGLKCVDTLLRAFIEISAARPDWDLVVMGDGPLRATLEAMVPAELKSRVNWTGFFREQERVSAMYRLCDVLVLPSNYEAWSLVMIEAATAGMALVASSAVGVAPDLIEEGANGFVFPVESLPDLCQSLLSVTDEAMLRQRKDASLRRVQEWSTRNDPIAGLRHALVNCAVLKTVSVGPNVAIT